MSGCVGVCEDGGGVMEVLRVGVAVGCNEDREEG